MELELSCPTDRWNITKTYAELEVFAADLAKYAPESPKLPKFSTFEPLLFGTPDYLKASVAAGIFIDLAIRVPNAELITTIVDFFNYKHGSNCLNQMSVAREYKNKHGMTLTHYNMGSGLELNYALFAKNETTDSRTESSCVLEGWKTACNYLDKVAQPQKGGDAKSPQSPVTSPSADSKKFETVADAGKKSAADDLTQDKDSHPSHDEKRAEMHYEEHNECELSVRSKESRRVSINESEEENENGESKPQRPASAGGNTVSQDKTDNQFVFSSESLKVPSDPIKTSILKHKKVMDFESLEHRDQESKRLQKTPIGIFHHKFVSKNLDCKVTCLETFSEADLVIAGFENGKIAAFKEVYDEEQSQYKLEFLAKVKLFKESVKKITLSSSKGVLYCVGDKDSIAVVDMCNWKIVEKKNLGGTIFEFIYEEDYEVAYVTTGNNKVLMLDLSDTKKIKKREIKVTDGITASIRAMDLDSEGGLIFCSDAISGVVSVLDIEFPFSFQSAVTLKTSSYGLANCSLISFWEKRKELYCSFPNGIISVHKLFSDSEDLKLDFITSCRVADSEIHLINHFADCPFLFTSSTCGTLTLWNPPDHWKQPLEKRQAHGPMYSK